MEEEQQTQQDLQVPMNSEAWSVFRADRRRMAWLALLSTIIFTAVLFVWPPVERLEKMEDIITWYYMAMTTIVLGYLGFKSWTAIKGKK